MREYLPQFADWIDLTNAGAGDTGDGMQMALDVGGVFYNDPYVITLGSTSRNGSIAGFCMSVNLWGRMVINSKAQRFFNEGYMPYQANAKLTPIEPPSFQYYTRISWNSQTIERRLPSDQCRVVDNALPHDTDQLNASFEYAEE